MRWTLARAMRAASADTMMAPSILASSDRRWGVNSASRRKPPGADGQHVGVVTHHDQGAPVGQQHPLEAVAQRLSGRHQRQSPGHGRAGSLHQSHGTRRSPARCPAHRPAGAGVINQRVGAVDQPEYGEGEGDGGRLMGGMRGVGDLHREVRGSRRPRPAGDHPCLLGQPEALGQMAGSQLPVPGSPAAVGLKRGTVGHVDGGARQRARHQRQRTDLQGGGQQAGRGLIVGIARVGGGHGEERIGLGPPRRGVVGDGTGGRSGLEGQILTAGLGPKPSVTLTVPPSGAGFTLTV